MKITKGQHKQALTELFYEPNARAQLGRVALIAKEFSLEKLFDASSAKKKLMPLIRTATDEEILAHLNGKKTTPEEMEGYRKNAKITFFEDKEIELTIDESVILKDLFDSKKNWSIDQAEIIKELKDIFYPSKG